MRDKLKILLLEDLPTDADLINRTLLKDGLDFELRTVDDKEDFVREIKEFNPDIILSDYSLPQYSGIEALQYVLKLPEYIPFIIVTGSINEDTAVECIKQGATDYVTKENLLRLSSAIDLALERKNNILKKEEAEKALRESERRFRYSFDYANIGMCLLGLEGEILQANPKLSQILGYSNYELEKLNIYEVTHPDDIEISKETHDNCIKGISESAEIEKRYIHKNGNIIWVNISLSLIKDTREHPLYFISHIQDITQKKEIDDALFNAKEKAEESDRLKSSFLATISHELRTPLNAIIGFSELLLRSEENVVNKVFEYAQIIFDSGKNLLSIINDIFDISLIEANEVKIYPELFSLNNSITEIRDNFKDNKDVKTKNLKINFIKGLEDHKDRVLTDRVKFNQVLNNLLGNAVKFTEKGEIILGYELKNSDHVPWLEFYVKDTGIGIPEDKTEMIFDSFRQVDDTNTRRYGGSGLGLTIAKKIVELLGGKIWVESVMEKGSTFYFTLPYKSTDQKDEKGEEKTGLSNDWNNKTALIVEDVEMNYLYIDEILDETGINRLWAKSGKEALELFEQHNEQLDIILMDIMLPDIDGYRVTEQIRSKNSTVPIIAQTAFALSGDQEKTIEAGCNDYIPKPLNQNELIKLMSKYLSV